MLIYRITDKSKIFEDVKILEINSDSLITYKNNDRFQIPYCDIEELSVFKEKNKEYLKIVYSGADKLKKITFTIGNIPSPQVIVETIQKNIKRDIEMFSAIKISYYQ